MARKNQTEAEKQAMTKANYDAQKEQNERTKSKKMEAFNNTRGQAYETKLEKEATKRRFEEQKNAEETKAQQMKTMIKQQQQEALRKKDQDLIERQQKIKQQIEEKLHREAYEQQMYEQEVQRMEREELELINRLKDTKKHEEQAHQQLEKALTDPNVGKSNGFNANNRPRENIKGGKK